MQIVSPLETVCMKCLFSGKNKSDIAILSSSELSQRVVTVKMCIALIYTKTVIWSGMNDMQMV